MSGEGIKFSEKDIEALKRAITSGTQTVSYSDRSVTYRSLDEMIRLLNLITRGKQIRKKYAASFSSGRIPR